MDAARVSRPGCRTTRGSSGCSAPARRDTPAHRPPERLPAAAARLVERRRRDPLLAAPEERHNRSGPGAGRRRSASHLLHTFNGVEPVSARLSPDGRFVAATIGVPTPDVRTDVVMVDVDSGVSQVLHEGVAPESEPAWTPDGSRVFFLKASSGTAGSRDGWEIPVADGQAAGEARLAARDLGNVSWVHLADDGLIARPVWTTSAEVYTRSMTSRAMNPQGRRFESRPIRSVTTRRRRGRLTGGGWPTSPRGRRRCSAATR